MLPEKIFFHLMVFILRLEKDKVIIVIYFCQGEGKKMVARQKKKSFVSCLRDDLYLYEYRLLLLLSG
jgi:hypothetical protein